MDDLVTLCSLCHRFVHSLAKLPAAERPAARLREDAEVLARQRHAEVVDNRRRMDREERAAEKANRGPEVDPTEAGRLVDVSDADDLTTAIYDQDAYYDG